MIVKNSFFFRSENFEFFEFFAGKSAYSGYLQGMGLKSTKTKGTKLKLTLLWFKYHFTETFMVFYQLVFEPFPTIRGLKRQI